MNNAIRNSQSLFDKNHVDFDVRENVLEAEKQFKTRGLEPFEI